MHDPIKPFRWNLAKREQIGDLIDIAPAESYRGFRQQLRAAAAQTLARAGDCDLVFVGRSPEFIFDYLSGIFSEVDEAPSLTLIQFSAPYEQPDKLAKTHAAELTALLSYFAAERIDPLSIASFGKPVRFIDVVASGLTFGTLVAYLKRWAREQGADWNVVERRIGFIGLTRQTQTSPKTWRWWQRQSWVQQLSKTEISNVSLPWELYGYLGDGQAKVTPSHRLYRWAAPEAENPVRELDHLRGLRLAVDLYDCGRDKHERALFVRELTGAAEMREAWLRRLVLRLRGAGA